MPNEPEDLAVTALSSGALLALPKLALGCAVCFGGEEVRLVKAFYWGGGLLLALTFGILAVLVRYILRSERRKKELYRSQGLMKEGEHYPGRLPL